MNDGDKVLALVDRQLSFQGDDYFSVFLEIGASDRIAIQHDRNLAGFLEGYRRQGDLPQASADEKKLLKSCGESFGAKLSFPAGPS